MDFYLGAPDPGWLARAGVRLFVSHRRPRTRKSLPKAAAPWALDSGGFSELSQHGRWTISPEEYAESVALPDVETPAARPSLATVAGTAVSESTDANDDAEADSAEQDEPPPPKPTKRPALRVVK